MDDIINSAVAITEVSSLDDFLAWLDSLSVGAAVVFGLGAIGLLILIYIVIAAMFMDKYN